MTNEPVFPRGPWQSLPDLAIVESVTSKEERRRATAYLRDRLEAKVLQARRSGWEPMWQSWMYDVVREPTLRVVTPGMRITTMIADEAANRIRRGRAA